MLQFQLFEMRPFGVSNTKNARSFDFRIRIGSGSISKGKRGIVFRRESLASYRSVTGVFRCRDRYEAPQTYRNAIA